MSRSCRPHSSPRRTPVTTTSHRYKPRVVLRARASAMTVATSSGEVAGMGGRMVVGGLADSAGLRSVHSQRCAAANAPPRDKPVRVHSFHEPFHDVGGAKAHTP